VRPFNLQPGLEPGAGFGRPRNLRFDGAQFAGWRQPVDYL